MLIDHVRLAFPKADKVDDIAEYLDQSGMSRSVEIAKGEILDAALEEQFAHGDEETHELARVRREYALNIVAAHVLGCSTHRGRHDFASRVGEQFSKPFEDFLNLLRVGLSEVFEGEVDTNVADASCYLLVRLAYSQSCA